MSILVTRPLPQGEELVSRLRALGRVAWSFPLIEFTPGRQLPELGGQLASLAAGDLLFALSQHAVEFAHARLQQQGCAGPRRPTILPLAAPPRWPCIRSVIDKFATR
jgi:uroporphyrinogen-III synthase